mgnify:FL=1|jgi:hypothetical protein
MPTSIDPKTGKTIHHPYPGDPDYQAPKQAAQPQVQRRSNPQGGRPPERRISRQRQLPPQQAQPGPALGGNPAGLGHYGALGAVPGIGQRGAVGPESVLPRQRRRGGLDA